VPKLNQVVAVVASKKKDAEKAITELYHKVKKPDLFTGLTRTYETIDDGGEELPSERKIVQLTVADAIASFRQAMSDVFNTVLTQDYGNTEATADVKVDGHVIIQAVPVTYLLFLEKKLTDIITFVSHLPVLDPSQEWTLNDNTNCFVTAQAWKYHTKKLPRVLEKSPATDKHPAQVELVHEDKNVGRWKTINQSGAIPAKVQYDMTVRAKQLLEGVKKAREEANMRDVANCACAAGVFDFIFGKP
jgi:hypothetical protein